jgi:branched-chain amino acid transport system permease protein
MLGQVPQWIATGLALGAIYALIALGFVMIYAVTDVINLAQGEFLMLGALLAVTFSRQGWPLAAAAVVAVAATMLVGVLVQLLALRPARDRSVLTSIIITIGVSIALRGGALLLWGTDPYPLPRFTGGPALRLGGAIVQRQDLWIAGALALSAVALWLFFNRTLLGKGLRACAINPTAARLMGVRPGRMATLAFALGAGLAGLAGVVIAPKTNATYDMGFDLGLKGFVAAIIGGLTSPVGAVVGGLLIGVLEAVGGGIKSAYKEAVAFAILVIVLLARRFGPFGTGEASGGGL